MGQLFSTFGTMSGFTRCSLQYWSALLAIYMHLSRCAAKTQVLQQHIALNKFDECDGQLKLPYL